MEGLIWLLVFAGLFYVMMRFGSSAGTMVEALRLLARAELPAATCVAVHALFADDALERLHAAGARDVATSDTIPHPTNRFSVLALLADGVRSAMRRGA